MLTETELTTATTHLESRVAVKEDPLALVARLARAHDSTPHLVYERADEYTIAVGVLAELRVSPHRVRLTVGHAVETYPTPHSTVTDSPDPLRALARFTERIPVTGWRMYGWVAFELAPLLAGLPVPDPDSDLLHVFVPETEVRIRDGHALIRATNAETLSRLESLITAVPRVPSATAPRVSISVQDTGNYRAAVADAVTRIRSGALEKVILSRIVPVPEPVDLIATYVAGRRANTPARSFLLRLGRMRAAGFSPEIVVEVSSEGRVSAQPLAGTRARGTDALTEQLGRELQADPKEVYEHAVSVRAVWGELEQSAACSDVRIDQYMAVSQRGSVQHLASALSGQLPATAGPWSAFAALFPSITAAGIPKPEAYQVIRDLEPGPRGLYAGAVLMCTEHGVLDAALVLRTVFQDVHGTWLQAGAGIVAQSNPEREHEETCEKLRSVAGFLVGSAEAEQHA